MLTHVNIAHAPSASQKVCLFMLIRGLQPGQVNNSQTQGQEHSTSSAGSFVFLPRGASTGSEPQTSRRPLPIAVPGGIEDCFHQTNAAATDHERIRIGERYGIHVVPKEPSSPRGLTLPHSAQIYPIGASQRPARRTAAGAHSGGYTGGSSLGWVTERGALIRSH